MGFSASPACREAASGYPIAETICTVPTTMHRHIEDHGGFVLFGRMPVTAKAPPAASTQNVGAGLDAPFAFGGV